MGFLMESVIQQVESAPHQFLLRILSATSSHPSHSSHNSALWMGQEINGPFWQHPTQLEKLHVNSHALTCPCRRNHGPGRALLAFSCSAFGEAWCSSSETIPFTLFNSCKLIRIFFFFLPQHYASTSLQETWISTKALSFLSDGLKQDFPGTPRL